MNPIHDVIANDLSRLAEDEDRVLTADARILEARRRVLDTARSTSPEKALALVGGDLASWICDLTERPGCCK